MIEMFPIPLNINLDDTIYLRIEPFNMDRMSRLSMSQAHNTSFSTVCPELSHIVAMSISELYEYLDDRIDGLVHSSLYMRKSHSPQVSNTPNGFQYLRVDDIIPRTWFDHFQKISNSTQMLPSLSEKKIREMFENGTIPIFIGDDDIFRILIQKTLQNKESCSRTSRVRVCWLSRNGQWIIYN